MFGRQCGFRICLHGFLLGTTAPVRGLCIWVGVGWSLSYIGHHRSWCILWLSFATGKLKIYRPGARLFWGVGLSMLSSCLHPHPCDLVHRPTSSWSMGMWVWLWRLFSCLLDPPPSLVGLVSWLASLPILGLTSHIIARTFWANFWRYLVCPRIPQHLVREELQVSVYLQSSDTHCRGHFQTANKGFVSCLFFIPRNSNMMAI